MAGEHLSPAVTPPSCEGADPGSEHWSPAPDTEFSCRCPSEKYENWGSTAPTTHGVPSSPHELLGEPGSCVPFLPVSSHPPHAQPSPPPWGIPAPLACISWFPPLCFHTIPGTGHWHLYLSRPWDCGHWANSPAPPLFACACWGPREG